MRAWLVALWISACGAPSTPAPRPPADDGLAAWNAWREERRESIAGEDGWLTLIGLHWLDEGEVTIGSDPGSSIVLPADRAPEHLGRLISTNGEVSFEPSSSTATIDGAPITARVSLIPDDPGPPTIVEVGSLRMHVIARADRRGLRIKDRASPARESFAGLPVFDHDPRYRVPARLVPAASGEVLPIVNVLGMEVDEPLVGRVEFDLDDTHVSLLAIAGGENTLFVMFRDATSDAGETYGAGRYIEVATPGAHGATWIDFNFAYTPPCAFTSFATCPLAPAENTIPIAIRAGERAPPTHP